MTRTGARATQGWRLVCAIALLAPGLHAEPAGEIPPQRTGVAQLEQLARGQLPEDIALSQLFPFDLLNETDVAARRAELQEQAATLEAGSPEQRAAELRLEILSSPLEFRRALVETDQRRMAAQLEQERAEAERVQAEEDALKAEQARTAALESAEAARSAAERFYATELAAAESARLDQARFRQRLAEQRAAAHGTAGVEEDVLRDRAQEAVAGATSNRALYEECVAALTAARAAVRAALDTIEKPIDVPRYVPPPNLPADAALTTQRQRLVVAAAEIGAAAEGLAADVRQLRHLTARDAYERQQRLNQVRLRLLPRLAEDDRREILGWGATGLSQLQRELEHLRLQWRWYRYARGNLDVVWASMTDDPALIMKLVRDGILFAVLCIGALAAARRGGRWLERAGASVVRSVRDDAWRRAALGALNLVERLWSELLLVSVALLAPSALGRVAGIAEVTVALQLFLLFAVYRLLLGAAYLGIAWLSAGGASLAPRLRALTLRSLRLVGLYVLVTLCLLVLSEDLLGRGYLFSRVANIWWIGGLPIGALLVRWWQPDIVAGYLAFRGTGTMAEAVRATRERWYGFFVAIAAVAVLIVVAAGRLAARFALGFDQTRKALAFLFRRRLEKQAKQQGEVPRQELDDDLVRHLSEDPVEGADLLTSQLPGLDEFVRAARAWSEGKPLIPSLLVGDTGFGKSTWLRAAAAQLREGGIPVRQLALPHHVTEPDQLLGWLTAGLETTASSWQQLADQLAERPEVVLLDDAHLLFSRRLGGFEAWDAFSRIAGSGASRTFWLLAVARYPHDYLMWARNGLTAPFRRVWKLRPWSDTEIAELLRARMRAAGYSVRYDNLVVDRVEGVEHHSQLLRTETEYARLIWDYADGCPRTALRCWRASLTPAGPRTVSVHLFRRPPVDRLERLSQRERFILACLVWHQTLTPALASSVLDYPEALCADTLALLRDWQVAREIDGSFRLDSDWLQPVRRLLRRENMLA